VELIPVGSGDLFGDLIFMASFEDLVHHGKYPPLGYTRYSLRS